MPNIVLFIEKTRHDEVRLLCAFRPRFLALGFKFSKLNCSGLSVGCRAVSEVARLPLRGLHWLQRGLSDRRQNFTRISHAKMGLKRAARDFFVGIGGFVFPLGNLIELPVSLRNNDARKPCLAMQEAF